MTRRLALDMMKDALLVGNQKKAMRLYIENRIARRVFDEYWRKYYREPVR